MKIIKRGAMLSLASVILMSVALGCAHQESDYSSHRYLYTEAQAPVLTRTCGADHQTQTWGVIIGINEYLDEGITDLKGSVSDAWIFYHYLTSPSGGRVPTKQLKLLLNQEATRTNVEGAIGNFLSQSCPQDKVVIYFAGHGAPEPGRESDAFLLMHDTTLDNMVGSAVSMQRLPEFLTWRAENVGELLLIVDACHSGNISFPNQRGVKKPPNVAAKERSKGITESIERLSGAQKSWNVISAAAANQYAGELTSECGNGVSYTGGLFTCHLIEALKGAADANHDQGLSPYELYSYVSAKVSKLTAGAQTPTFSGTSSKEAPFFTIPQAQAEVEIPKVPELYTIKEYRSVYTPVRWSGLGLTLAAGVSSALLRADANNLTREVNTFNYRSQTSKEYSSLLAQRDEAINTAKLGLGVTALLAVSTLAISLIELYDQPEGREEVYRVKPWFVLPIKSSGVESGSSVGVKVEF